jgi:hypothetical protein
MHYASINSPRFIRDGSNGCNVALTDVRFEANLHKPRSSAQGRKLETDSNR